MALGAVLAAALTDHSAHPFSLLINGVDVIRQPGQQGNAYGVPLESIEVDEAAPGQVSSMRFVIDDPLNVVGIYEGAWVRFVDNVHDVAEFAGFVDTADVIPGGASRSIEVNCIGIEVALDWMIVPSLTVPSGTLAPNAVQLVASAALPAGVVLNWNQGSGGSNPWDYPVRVSTGIATYGDLVISQQTLRQALQSLSAVFVGGPTGQVATVDFMGGLRFPAVSPSPWFTLADTGASPRPSNLKHSPVAGGAVRAVYVNGGNAAGSGLVTDGSGIPGRIAILDEPQSVTAQWLAQVAAAYLSANDAQPTGTVDIDALAQQTGRDSAYRSFSNLAITSGLAGLAGEIQTIQSVHKSWRGNGVISWRITYGRNAMLGSTEIRALTRTTLS